MDPPLWRHRAFTKLWAAETTSQFGTQISYLGIPFIAVLLLQASPLTLGLLRFMEYLPYVLVGLPIGVMVDRMRRRPILIASEIGRAIVLLAIPVCYAFGVLAMWQLLLVSVLAGTLTVWYDVAYQSYLPAVIPAHFLLSGNAALEGSRSTAQIAGPGLAGGFIQLLTAPIALVAEAFSHLVSASLVAAIRTPEPFIAPTASADGPSLMAELRDGLHFVLGNGILKPIAFTAGLANLSVSGMEALYVLFAVRYLGLRPAAIGLIYSLGNTGLVAGSLFAVRLGRRFGIGRVLLGGIVLEAAGMALVPLAPSTAFPIAILVMGQLARSFGFIIWNINQVSLRQALTPDRMTGRMTATMRFIGWSGLPLGGLLGGVAAAAVGVPVTLWAGAVIAILSAGPLALSPARSVQRLPERQT